MHQDQTIFSIKNDNRYNESDFIVSSSNSEAHKIITSWPGLWGIPPYDRALILIGPKFSGKTFLSTIWQNITSPERSEYLSPSGNYKIIYEDIDLLDQSKEEELFHIINSTHEEGKYLLLTATKFPKYSLKDLSSRINSINIARISLPDDELLTMLIFKLFSDNSVKINSDIVKYLVNVLPRDFVSVKNVIEKINKEALVKGRRVTIPFIKTILALGA